MTWSPTCQRPGVSDGPRASITPETSRPRMSDAPGGGGYLPCRCTRSGRFTPAADTRIKTSPWPAIGSDRSPSRRTSGPPKEENSTTRTGTSMDRVLRFWVLGSGFWVLGSGFWYAHFVGDTFERVQRLL